MAVKVRKVKENIWEIEREGKMNVPGRIFASDVIMTKVMEESKSLEQIKNVATLPGTVGYSLAMPDVHVGYGFPVGGVAAFDLDKGIISPGGIGYDINCGVRLMTSNLSKKDFLKKREKIVFEIKKNVPSGVGKRGEFRLSEKEIEEIMKKGVSWAVEKGYGVKKDIENCEDSGCLKGAEPRKVSGKAKGRGRNQLATLGAGNHFLEVQEIEEIYDSKTAKTFGLKKGNVCVLIHSGSRGLGHQTASDYIRKMEKKYGFKNLPDRELACAPIKSELAQDYLEAMRCAANFAFTNRHLIMCQVRKAFEKHIKTCKLDLVYDVAHNIAKFEKFKIDGKTKELCVHRKGATRSFGKGRKELPKKYQKTGQPIFIPGSMGTYSYVLVGTSEARDISFASTAHGAGRVLSRTHAKQILNLKEVKDALEKYGVYIEAGSEKGLIEEAPQAYKDVNEVVRVSDELGIGRKVARLRPLAVIKG